MVPVKVSVHSDGRLSWRETLPDDGRHELKTGDLLDDFVSLAAATAQEMAAFMESYGVPELCGAHSMPDWHRNRSRPKLRGAHSTPDWHRNRSRPELRGQRAADVDLTRTCPMAVDDDGAHVTEYAIRLAARAFAAARRLGVALSAHTNGDVTDWQRVQNIGIAWPPPGESEGWREQRRHLAAWVTHLLRECGVAPFATWEGERLIITTEADGLLGTLAIALAQDIGQGDAYLCDVCGRPWNPYRPPRSGERVYCDNPACKREQQRRNQATWRARRKTNKED